MAGKESQYKQIRPEEAVTDVQLREALSALDQPWQPEKARFTMAIVLTVGLLAMFGLTIACSSVVIVGMIGLWAVQGTGGADVGEAIDKMLAFVTMLIPFIATPLGIALGFFFRELRPD